MVVINEIIFYPHACSMAIHIALKETGQEFDTEFVDLSTKVTGSDWII